MDNGGTRILNNVQYIPKFMKNLTSLGTLKENGFFCKFDGDKDIMKVGNGALTMMKVDRTTSNIYKLFGSTFIGDVASIESDIDATKLYHMCLCHLSERDMTKLH